MRTMRSPRLMPALPAGVPGIGFMTVSAPLRMAMTMPSPPKEPRVWIFISAFICGSRRVECGSSVPSIPLTAAYSMLRTVSRSMPGGRFCATKRKISRMRAASVHGESTSEVWKSCVAVSTRTVTLLLSDEGSTSTSATDFCTWSSDASNMLFGSMRVGSTYASLIRTTVLLKMRRAVRSYGLSSFCAALVCGPMDSPSLPFGPPRDQVRNSAAKRLTATTSGFVTLRDRSNRSIGGVPGAWEEWGAKRRAEPPSLLRTKYRNAPPFRPSTSVHRWRRAPMAKRGPKS